MTRQEPSADRNTRRSGDKTVRTIVLVISAAGILRAAPALGAGFDLSVNACPGNPGASSDAGTLDCAGGQQLTLLATFISATSAQLTGIQFPILITVSGDVGSDATFWDFDDVNHTGWRAYRERPAQGCSNYTDAWSGAGSTIWGGLSHGGSQVRLTVACFRQSGVAVAAGERVFGAQIVIYGATSVEAGGSGKGCSVGACVVIPEAAATQADGMDASRPIATSPGFTNVVTINGLEPSNCSLVPVRRHTWGQLKSLYR